MTVARPLRSLFEHHKRNERPEGRSFNGGWDPAPFLRPRVAAVACLGHVIERSDKLIALLTKDAVVMVADGEKGARVVESTSLASIKCAGK